MSAPSIPADTAAGKNEPTTESATNLNIADVQSAIVRQVEFYFSDANLPTDKFLLKQVQSNPQGYVPIKLIAQFKRVKALSKGLDVVTEALKLSNELVVSEDGVNVKRLKPLPDVNENDIKRRTVIITQLPGVPSIESVTDQFSRYGAVKLVRICPPGSTEKLPQWLTGANPSVAAAAASNQLFALVEFATEDAANRAVSDNTSSNWRDGLMVRRLVPTGYSSSPTPTANMQQKQHKKQRELQQGGPSRGPAQHGYNLGFATQQLQQGMSNLKLFAGDAVPVPSPRHYGIHTQYPGQQHQGSYRNQSGQHPLHTQARNPASQYGQGSFPAGARGYQRDPRGGHATSSPPNPLLTTGGTMEAVLYTPPGGDNNNINANSTTGVSGGVGSNNNANNNGGSSNRRSSSVTPAQKFLLVRPRLEASTATPANAAALRTTPADFTGRQGGGEGYSGGSPPGGSSGGPGGSERSVSVGRRAPHFVIDADYRPPEGERGRHAGKVRPRGREDNIAPPQHMMSDQQGRRISLPGQGGQMMNPNVTPPNPHNERKRGKSARGQNPNPDLMSSSPGAAAMLQAAGGAAGLQGLQGLMAGGGPLQLQNVQPPVGQEQAWQQLISAVQQLVQHQFGGLPAAGQSPFAGSAVAGAEGAVSAGATPANSAANSSNSTPAKLQQQQQQQKKGKQKGAKQHADANGSSTAAGSKDLQSLQTGEAGGVFVFHGDSDAAGGQAGGKATTPVAKAAHHGKKGAKGTPGGQGQAHGHGHGHAPAGAGSAKKAAAAKEGGAQNGGDGTGGGNGSGEEAAEDLRKKRTKKDYANWAAATAGYRAQSAAMYGQGEGGNGAEGAASSSAAGGQPQLSKDAALAAVRTPKVPDGTRGFGMGRGRALPPPPPA